MKLVEIDVVGLESFQARLASLDDVEAAVANEVWLVGHTSVDLGCKEYAVSLAVAFECFTNELFGCAFAVNVCGIEEVDAFADCVVDYFAGVFKIGFLTEHHAAENEGAYVDAGAAE